MMLLVLALFISAVVTLVLSTRFMRIKQNYNDLYVLITGCDSGFGRELAYKLDNLGFNVIATCLSEDGVIDLDKNTSETLITAQIDVRKATQISNLVEKVKGHLPNERALWGVVNNAGIIGSVGPSEFLSRKEYLQCLDVNFFGMVEINRQFIPLVRESGGRIVNMISMAGRVTAPSMTCYTVSKFAAEGYSDCLRRELYHHGVSVHIIEPGLFSTGITYNTDYVSAIERTFEKGNKEIQKYYGLDYPYLEGTRLKEFNRFGSKHTYKVVNAYVEALTARFPKQRYVVGLDANICVLFLALPEWICDFVMAKFGTIPAALRTK